MSNSNAQIILDHIASLMRELEVERLKSKQLADELRSERQIYESGNNYVSDVKSEFNRIREEHVEQQITINSQKHQILELQERLAESQHEHEKTLKTNVMLRKLLKGVSDLVSVPKLEAAAIRLGREDTNPNESEMIRIVHYYREMTGQSQNEARESIAAAMKKQ